MPQATAAAAGARPRPVPEGGVGAAAKAELRTAAGATALCNLLTAPVTAFPPMLQGAEGRTVVEAGTVTDAAEGAGVSGATVIRVSISRHRPPQRRNLLQRLPPCLRQTRPGPLHPAAVSLQLPAAALSSGTNRPLLPWPTRRSASRAVLGPTAAEVGAGAGARGMAVAAAGEAAGKATGNSGHAVKTLPWRTAMAGPARAMVVTALRELLLQTVCF